jgi:iron complex outermembrane receptor protein
MNLPNQTVEIQVIGSKIAYIYRRWSKNNSNGVTPSLDLADDRWSDLNTAPAASFPYVKTGAYSLLGLDAPYQATNNIQFSVGSRI